MKSKLRLKKEVTEGSPVCHCYGIEARLGQSYEGKATELIGLLFLMEVTLIYSKTLSGQV